MAICQIMIYDFLYGHGRYDEVTGQASYSNDDLQQGLLWAEWLAEEGVVPLYGYNPRKLAEWCRVQLRDQSQRSA